MVTRRQTRLHTLRAKEWPQGLAQERERHALAEEEGLMPKRPHFLSTPDPEAETLYGIVIPGAMKRQRHDRRAKTQRPAEPLILYFTRRQLVTLRANAAAALLRSGDVRGS